MSEQMNAEGQMNVGPVAKKNHKFLIVIVIVILLAVLVLVGIFVKAKPRPIGQAYLSWDANTEANLAGYRIYYGPLSRTAGCPSGGYPEKVDIGKTDTPEKPSYTIKNLEEGETYYFSVTSYNGNAESCFSTEVSKTIKKSSVSQEAWEKIKSWF